MEKELAFTLVDLQYPSGQPLVDVNGLRREQGPNQWPMVPFELKEHAGVFEMCVEMLRQMPMSKKGYSSYQIKHHLERLAKIEIPAGVVIAAAYKVGLVSKDQLLRDARKGIHTKLRVAPEKVK